MEFTAPDVIDEVAFDPDTNEIVLIIRALDSWGEEDGLIDIGEHLKEKLTSYITFSFAGQLAEAFPEHKDDKVRIQINCTEMPPVPMLELLEKIDSVVSANGARLIVNHLVATQP